MKFVRQFGGRWLEVADPLFRWSGLVLLALAAGFWAHEWTWSHAAVRASGTVVELEGRMDAQGELKYFPRVRFRDKSGAWVQATSRVGGDADAFGAGDAVPVVYRAGDPQDAEIATKTRVYFVAIVLGVLGVILFDLGAALWVMRRREVSPGG
jgi:hypothetical protein